MIYGNFRADKMYYCNYTPLVTYGREIVFLGDYGDEVEENGC